MGRTGLARVRATFFALVMALLCLPCAAAESATQCAAEADAAVRLACYDALFRKPAQDAQASSTPGAAAATPPAGNALSPAGAPGLTARRCDPTEDNAGWVGSPMSALWELRCDHKRGTFIVRTYLPNFVLPVHVSSSLNRAPSSPTQGTARARPNFNSVEAKLQLSLRAKVFEGLLLPDGDLWFAYTQRSLWQVWDSRDSSPFHSTDYQPEAIYVLRAPAWLSELPAGWRWRMFQLGIAHQSNGQSDPLSRSWTRVYAGAGIERGDVGLQVRALERLHDSSDDNPDLTRYIGGAEVLATWNPGLSIAVLTWRTGAPIGRGSSRATPLNYPNVG